MARTDLDRALLGEDLALDVTLRSVDSLTPVQLAIVAGRDDLDGMVQSRAYAAFLSRKAAFDAAGGTVDPSQGLFALPFDTKLSDRVEELTPTELALAPFNTCCTEVDFLKRAGLRFRRLAREFQADLCSKQLPSPSLSPSLASKGPFSSPTPSPRPQDGSNYRTFAAESCSFSWGDEFARTIGPVEVKLEEDEIVIAFQNQPLFNILASKLCLFLYLEGETQGEHQEMTLQLEAYDTIMEGKNRLGPPFNLRLSLGMTPRDALSTLATAVENWRQCFGFLVSNLPATPTPSEGFAHIPPSRVNITLGYSTNTNHPRTPDATVGDATPASGAQIEPDEGGTARSQRQPAPTLQPSKDPSGPFRYLSQLPARPEWAAGFWVRLFVILQAICPHAGLSYPDLTREEVKILSHRADARKLPDLPHKRCPPQARHSPVARLGLEEIYRGRGKITIDQSRVVLLTADYPDLREYAHIMGKMVEARNAFHGACSYILEQDSAIGDCDSPYKLSRKHLELVRNLRESEVYRLSSCTEKNLLLSRTSKFAPNELEPSAHRRYEAALEEIVRIEDEIRGEDT